MPIIIHCQGRWTYGTKSIQAYKFDTPSSTNLVPINVVAKAIKYDNHKASLHKGIKALWKHCKRDWWNGSDIQTDMMYTISMEIMRWTLADLW